MDVENFSLNKYIDVLFELGKAQKESYRLLLVTYDLHCRKIKGGGSLILEKWTKHFEERLELKKLEYEGLKKEKENQYEYLM